MLLRMLSLNRTIVVLKCIIGGRDNPLISSLNRTIVVLKLFMNIKYDIANISFESYYCSIEIGIT